MRERLLKRQPAIDHELPSHAIVRPDCDRYLVVADGYHSLLHAARVSRWLSEETGFQCLLHDGAEVQGFDGTIMSGDVIRMTDEAVETFRVDVRASAVVLVPDQRCEAAPLMRIEPTGSAASGVSSARLGSLSRSRGPGATKVHSYKPLPA